MSEKVSKVKAKHKVFAPFFDSDDDFKTTINIIYPYYYSRVDNEKTFALPIPFGSKDSLNKNNFDEKNAVWFSKNSHENPEYLLESLQYGLTHVFKNDGKLVMVDGAKLATLDYPDSDQVKLQMETFKDNIWYTKDSSWIPYDKMQYTFSKSKFTCGIHHPIVPPTFM
jgi:hypothetical protein